MFVTLNWRARDQHHLNGLSYLTIEGKQWCENASVFYVFLAEKMVTENSRISHGIVKERVKNLKNYENRICINTQRKSFTPNYVVTGIAFKF